MNEFESVGMVRMYLVVMRGKLRRFINCRRLILGIFFRSPVRSHRD